MPNTQPASQFIALFPDEEISRILQNIQNLLPTLSRPLKTCKRPEDELSDQLFKKIRIMPEYRTGPITAMPIREPSILDDEGKKKPDVCFFSIHGIETYFAVEAKRLFIRSGKGVMQSLIQEYIDEGMMRFITGYYAPTQEAGAMLGYVFDVSIATAETTLSGKIAASSQKLCMTTSWQKSNISIKPPINETEHDLHGRKFVIYHLLTKV